MRKKYISPTIRVKELKARSRLLAASNPYADDVIVGGSGTYDATACSFYYEDDFEDDY